MKKTLFLILLVVASITASAQRNNVYVPSNGKFKILVCDFHTHTIFSDGVMWPTGRIDEAVAEGLDAISLTDHIEYRPKKSDLTSRDHNRSYEIAKAAAANSSVLLIQGTEITRAMPPGHLNAIFISNANVLDAFIEGDNYRDGANIKETLREIKKQGAFVFWNHPNFPGKQPAAILHPIHKELIAEKLIDGIEVVNGEVVERESLDWCLENNLAVIGNSDVHGMMTLDLEKRGLSHRSITLVLAKEKSPESIREALNARRTVAVCNNELWGAAANVGMIVKSSLEVAGKMAPDLRSASVAIRNNSSIPYTIEIAKSNSYRSQGKAIVIPPYSSKSIQVNAPTKEQNLPSKLVVEAKIKNAFISSTENFTYQFTF